MQELKEAIKNAAKELFGVDLEPELTRPEEQFGDYSTNVALQLAAQLDKKPREIAEELVAKLQSPLLAKTEVAGPGFINFWLSDQALAALLGVKLAQNLDGQEILVEFGDPNPFKEMHIGHLYSSIVGDSISGLLDASGATVRRLSYHGDVGLHVARAIWGMQALKEAGKSLLSVRSEERPEFLFGVAYAYGADKYETDEVARKHIEQINRQIYDFVLNGEDPKDPEIKELYQTGRKWSFEHFDEIFDELGIKYDKNGRYLESAATNFGLQFVHKYVGKVFEESEGAIVYKGEKVGLHTRVFITSQGLPTYEAKDLGLAELKNRDYPNASRSIIITATEQSEYFKVMLAALAEIDVNLAKKTTHLSHGFLSLTTGKMSSRTGNVYSAVDLLKSVESTVDNLYPESEIKGDIYVGAIKYAFLKHRLGQDIVIDPKEAASLEGNSGPYLQYAFVRANSILAKVQNKVTGDRLQVTELEAGERSLTRKISEYPEVVENAVNELMPHHICTYLYELAQVFNRFYEKNRVVGDSREALRLQLVESYANVLKSGLEVLNIPTPERM